MRILHLLASVDPADGGPVEYARIVAAEHAKAGHESVFVTLDAPDAACVRDFPFTVHGTGPVAGFLKSTPRFAKTVAQLAPQSDAAVVHGLWTHASIGAHDAMKTANLPWVIFSHGMLDPYFRSAKPVKHWVKQVYWLLWQGRMLSDAAAVMFTCTEEQRLAQGAFAGHQNYPARVVAFCAADQRLDPESVAAARSSLVTALPMVAERPYWLFLSRIHPKKAVDTLISAYARLAQRPDCPDLVIAGPDSVGWQATLERLAETEGVARRVHFPGMVRGATKSAAFAGAEAFVLPSHQENFGLVVAEALSVGTPVLVSDKVNIWPEVVQAGAGMAEPDTLDGTERLLRRFLDLSADERSAMKAQARPCYDVNFSAHAAAGDLLAVLQEVSQAKARR
ncbi:glycosyltransferase [Frigidibacter albus]|uniref:Glycosyltransferase n=1 Tax=Frigidibacter albus TaxID=1465486 RepID=A0A6L8VGC3_9RHOB|nr:glycosyltransferase [Frigidibacter albus]MZQ88359.1 glycosyltransferase [Frigidibacter albus]NBE29967.1 glycosyltransferase [Frigidibacter albus]GGH45862.1 glycosyl transferase [Frigidibacter albus]